ncbi:hypothetical protein FQN52_002440, partial [Onygenales sp. PD_12]
MCTHVIHKYKCGDIRMNEVENCEEFKKGECKGNVKEEREVFLIIECRYCRQQKAEAAEETKGKEEGEKNKEDK